MASSGWVVLGLLAALMFPTSDAVLSSMTLKLARIFGPGVLDNFPKTDSLGPTLGRVDPLSGEIVTNFGAISNIRNVAGFGDIGQGIDHMNAVLDASMGAQEVMDIGNMDKLKDMNDISNLKDLTHDIKSIGTLGGQKPKLFSHPETCLPAVTGMTKTVAFNFTINFETSCPLPFGSHFRSIDGSCGHPDNLGAANKQIARLLPPIYHDGYSLPHMFSVTGNPLPSPRVVSRTIHTDQPRASEFTIMLMQWGQIMDHDMVSTPLPIEDTRDVITCCGPNKTLPRGDIDPECFPILFHGDNNFIGQCMEFVRSMPMTDSFGDMKLPREHMNAVTSFIDASTVYGSSEDILRELRDKHGRGYLFKLDEGKPIDNGKDDCIKRPDKNDICYLAGDERVNEHPGLTAIHTIFMRKHNQWAQQLREMVPWMPDEMVFQKTRAIVMGITQKIMYNDWLTLILGPEVAVQSGIYTHPDTLTYFDANYDPSIFHAFSTAVFRFGHTLIPKELFLGGQQREKLRDLFFKPYLLFEHFDEICTNLVSGLTDDDTSQQFDRFITEEVTNHLFENEEGIAQGFDLVAVNLQRARDHGLPGYNAYRELCGLHRITSWEDPTWGDAAKLFAGVYEHPDDVELFPGGINERPFKGGVVGETFNCLITRQLRNLKYGDRYFFSHDRGMQGFSRPQLAEIHRYTVAHLMCETTKIQEIQLNAFKRPGYDNPTVSCDELREHSLNMEPFAYMWA